MENKFSGKIIYKEGCQDEYINGAFGSVNQHGDFIVNFFFEQPSNSEIFNVEIDEDKNPKQTFNDNGIVKIVKSKLVFNIEVAKLISKWLKDNIDIYEKNKEGELK